MRTALIHPLFCPFSLLPPTPPPLSPINTNIIHSSLYSLPLISVLSISFILIHSPSPFSLPIFTLSALPPPLLWLPLIYLTFWSSLSWDSECYRRRHKRLCESTYIFCLSGPPVEPSHTPVYLKRTSVRSPVVHAAEINLLSREKIFVLREDVLLGYLSLIHRLYLIFSCFHSYLIPASG